MDPNSDDNKEFVDEQVESLWQVEEFVKAERLVQLKSADNVIFDISLKAMSQSNTLKVIMDYHMENPKVTDPIPLCNTDAKTAKLVVEWCEKHKDEQRAGGKLIRKKDYDREFTDCLSNSQICDLIIASNYLDIESLRENCYLAILNKIQGKSVKQIRIALGKSGGEGNREFARVPVRRSGVSSVSPNSRIKRETAANKTRAQSVDVIDRMMRTAELCNNAETSENEGVSGDNKTTNGYIPEIAIVTNFHSTAVVVANKRGGRASDEEQQPLLGPH
ncbi:unnamed protein product [Caenorhabditis sp. 36 PRJEB53466]|nr:unnamed protein product [Caenorhabditis sp. 36 PRJEB53466]